MISLTKPVKVVLVLLLVLAFGCKVSKKDNDASSDPSSYVGFDDARDVEWFLYDAPYDRFAPSKDVAKLSSMFNAIVYLRSGSGSCTGFLIHPNYIMTNQHCFYNKNSEEKASGVKRVDEKDGPLYYSHGVCSTLRIDHSHQVKSKKMRIINKTDFKETWVYSKCDRVIVANQARDFVIFKISPNKMLLDEIKDGTITPLKLGAKVAFHEGVFIVGHPQGNPKVISYYNQQPGGGKHHCRTAAASYPPEKGPKDAPNPYLAWKYPYTYIHDCDTTGGSSGSPIIDYKNLEVVGLHWDGWMSSKYPHYDKRGKIDDKSDVGNDQPYKEGNAAIHIAEIRKYVLSLENIPDDLREVFEK